MSNCLTRQQLFLNKTGTARRLLHNNRFLNRYKYVTQKYRCRNPSLKRGQRLEVQMVAQIAGKERGVNELDWKTVISLCAGAMFICSLHRVGFSSLASVFNEHLGVSLQELGKIQAATLLGYLVGQVPFGIIADRFGGPQTMMTCLALWSVTFTLMPIAFQVQEMSTVLVVLRFLFGFFSACIIPSCAATVAQLVPESFKSETLSRMQAIFNLGCVAGLGSAPLILQNLGLPATFLFLGSIGFFIGFIGICSTTQKQNFENSSLFSKPIKVSVQKPEKINKSSKFNPLKQYNITQFLILCWTHTVIGFDFFVFQNWIPMYLRSLGLSIQMSGIVSMLPWIGSVASSLIIGKIADQLIFKNKQPRWQVRRTVQLLATLGPALGYKILTSIQNNNINNINIFFIIFLVTLIKSMAALTISGFHSYIQDVSSNEAGVVLSLTNSCGIIAGLIGNLLTGIIVDMTNSYIPIFQICIIMYISSAIFWSIYMKGAPLKKDQKQYEYQ